MNKYLPELPHNPNEVIFLTIWEERQYETIWQDFEILYRVRIIKNTETSEYYLQREGKGGLEPTGMKPFTIINDITSIPEALGKTIEKAIATGKFPYLKSLSSESPETGLVAEICAKLRDISNAISTIEHSMVKQLIDDIKELCEVLRIGAKRSTLALCGRCLEVCLKVGLEIREIKFSDDLMVGRLLKLYEENDIYLDVTLKNQLNILNSYRISGVHVRANTEIPSTEQVLSLSLLLCDCLNRSIVEGIPK